MGRERVVKYILCGNKMVPLSLMPLGMVTLLNVFYENSIVPKKSVYKTFLTDYKYTNAMKIYKNISFKHASKA